MARRSNNKAFSGAGTWAAVQFFGKGRVRVIAGADHHDKGNPNQIVDLVDEILNGAPSGTRDLL